MADFDPEAFLAQSKAATPLPVQPDMAEQPTDTSTFDPEAFLKQSREEQFGTAGQQVGTAVEGALQGALGPAGPALERLAGVRARNIRGRAEVNPNIKTAGELAGLGVSALAGTGEAALMSKAGEAAEAAAGIGKLSYGARVGSEAVKQAAEMAVLQGSDEVSKMVVQDPNATVQNAIADVGLASVIGAGGGAFMAGAVNPLWKATAGPKVDQLLNMTKNYINGGSKLALGNAEEAAAKTLGIQIDPVMRSGMSEDATANGFFGDLRRGEHPEVLKGIENLHNNISNSVMESLGVTPEAVAEHSENVAGHELQDTFQKEVKEKYDPRAAEMQARDAEAAPMRIPDETRLKHAGEMVEDGINKVGTDSPYYKEYTHYADRLLSRDTVGEIDKLRTEIFGRMKAASRSGDDNTWKVLSDIRGSLGDLQENYLGQGFQNASRQATNANYAQYANTMDTVMGHLGLGEFKGTKGLLSKVTSKLSPEELLKKFNIKGNADLMPFMQQNFPNTYAKVIENERKQLIKPAILSAAKKGEVPVDVKKLADIINKTMAGKPEYVKAVLPPDAVSKVEAGKVLANAIPAPRDSGTPAGLQKLFRMMPANAIAAVSWATGHGVLGGLMAGEMAQRLGKDAPEAIKLGYLKFLSAEQPVKAEGFKAMVDMLNSTYKGNTAVSKAAANVFKPGFQVLSNSQIPSPKELVKLDKLVADNQKDPNKFMQAQQDSNVGHYLPQHQMALTQTSAQAMQYLNSIKPVPAQTGPLDKEIPPTKAQDARYNRALEIAQQPNIVMQHIKDGTLQTSDIQDLNAMYPALRQQMAQKLSNEMINNKDEENQIPYKTRVSLSLFLGQPLDSSMLPASIMAAQPIPKVPPQQQPQGKTKKGTSTLGKSNSQYKTPNQAAESDRSNRE